MTYRRPDPGHYIRKRDRVEIAVFGCTGSEWNSEVTCRWIGDGGRFWHVRLENFWKKYEEAKS